MQSETLWREQFPSAEHAIHFDHASVGPISVSVAAAMSAVVDGHVERGFQNSWRDEIARVRAQAARLVGSQPENIAFVQNTSFGLSLAANGITWRSGDNVVLAEREFPSNFYPWKNLDHLGVELRTVAAPAGHALISDIATAIDERTRAVTISAVQYSNGHRYDLGQIGELCSSRGVLLVVDGTQSVGALEMDVEAAGIDVLALSSHKWMLGPPGIGFAHLSKRALDQLRVPVVGWLSVREPFAFDYELDLPTTAERFEPGTENLVGILGLGGAIDLFERVGVTQVESRILDLTDYICATFASNGFQPVVPRETATRSGIVILKKDGSSTEAIYERLTQAGVKCAVRNGGVRFSPHFYNSFDEVDQALAALR